MFIREWPIPNFVMSLVMDRSNLGKFSGVAIGDIILARTFDSIPEDGVDIDSLDNRTSADVLHVTDVFKNSSGETINLNVELICHEDGAAGRPFVGTFRLDGDEVVKVRPGSRDRSRSFLGHYSSQGCSKFVSCAINPGGDMIRRHVLRGMCAAKCEKGWLRSLRHLDAHMPEGSKMADFPPVPRFRPLCPGCMGTELVVEQIELRVANDGARYDEAYVRREWGPFQRQVEQRHHALGYEDVCSCVFCLMPSTSHPHPRNHAEAVRMHLGLVEYNITTAVQDIPASEDAIAALPRMKLAGAKTEATYCTICQTDFTQDTTVAQLPCKHIICADECIDWLRHQNSCPECRRKIPSASVKIWAPRDSATLSTQTPGARESARDSDDRNEDSADDSGENSRDGSDDGDSEVRRMGNEDERRARQRGESIDGSELPIWGLRIEEQLSSIYGVGSADVGASPEASDNWNELERMGWEDQMRSRRSAGSLDFDDGPEAGPYGIAPGFYNNRDRNGWFPPTSQHIEQPVEISGPVDENGSSLPAESQTIGYDWGDNTDNGWGDDA